MRRIILLLAILALPGIVNAQASKPAAREEQPKLYTPEQIREKFDVEIIDGNYAPLVKSILEWMNRAGREEGYSADNVTEALKEMALRLPEPARGLVNFIVADFYKSYWRTNQWQIRNRTSAPDAGGTLDTWDLKRLFGEAIKYYRLSIENADVLKNTPSADYRGMLAYINIPHRGKIEEYVAHFYPTLYDFLLTNAIAAFKSEMYVVLPGQPFIVDDPRYFADAREFMNMDIPAPEEASGDYEILKLYQELLAFRLERFDREKTSVNFLPLVAADVERLEYLKSKGVYADAGSLYEAALRRIMDSYAEYPESAYAAYTLAAYYYREANRRGYDKTDESLRYKYVEAYELCEKVEKQWPVLAWYAQDLRLAIAKPSLTISFGRYQYPGDPFPVFVSHRNTARLYIRIYESKHGSEPSRIRNHASLGWLADREPVMVIDGVEMPSYDDFRTHTAQFVIDGLPQGRYLLCASDEPFNSDWMSADSKTLTVTMDFQVTPLTINIRAGNGRSFGLGEGQNDPVSQAYVTNSKTGRPVAGAKVEVYARDYDTPRDSNGDYPEMISARGFTDSQGMTCIRPPEKNRRLSKITVTTENGEELLENRNGLDFNYWGGNDDDDEEPVAIFFTDRAIYRPGQTVYYKAILIRKVGDGQNELVADHELDVVLEDVNGREIGKQVVATNDYGSVQGSFVIPHGLLNGLMIIDTEYGDTSIRVEEYKRPTFEVKFEPVEKNYRYDDRIEIVGSALALAGYTVDNSIVKYRVKRSPNYRSYRLWKSAPDKFAHREIADGEVTTGADGKFVITFPASAEGVINRNAPCDYSVSVDVTDVNGETRSASMVVTVSDKPLFVRSDIPETVNNRDSLKFHVITTTLNGKPVPADVFVTIEQLEGPDRILRARMWDTKSEATLISKEEFVKLFPNDIYADEDDVDTYPVKRAVGQFGFRTTVKPRESKVDLGMLKRQPAGWYKITLKAVGEDDIDTEETYTLRLNGTPSGKKLTPITHMNDWVYSAKQSGEPGEEAVFFVAGPVKNSVVRYDLFLDGRVVQNGLLKVDATPRKVVFPIKEEYRGGFSVSFIMTAGGRTYTRAEEVDVPFADRMLDISFATFRDQLLPGEHERWTLTVKNRDGGKEMAEMVATLYDASLDTFLPMRWPDSYDLFPRRRYYMARWGENWWSRLSNSSDRYYSSSEPKWFYLPGVRLARFDRGYVKLLNNDGRGNALPEPRMYGSGIADPGFRIAKPRLPESVDDIVVVGYFPISTRESYTGSMTTVKSEGVRFYKKDVDSFVAESEEMPGAAEKTAVPAEQIETRRNFNETAFFYPQLRTNEEGEIVIEFTIPESLTRWNMLGFAHTKDLKAGAVSNQLITRKQVAVSANAPRFVREGDRIEFSAKVNNITEDDLTGLAMLRLFDAATMQPLDDLLKSPAESEFNVAAGQSSGLKWTIEIPEGLSAVTYRLTAQAGSHTDGEEKTIPVLSNTVLVTETMPFMVRAGQTKTVDFQRLRDKAASVQRNRGLTLEFTSNPAWYAVQSMPYLMEYPYDCAEQIFSKFYANSLSAAIVNATPAIRRIFEQWRDVPDSRNALLSNLEKNQELKQVLLEETPWVMEAENEAERKKRLGLLFDLNRMGGEQRMAFEKLQKMQRGDGGFAWFDGLQPDRYITQHIVTGIGQLIKLNALSEEFMDEAKAMMAHAFEYLDADILRSYEKCKKYKKGGKWVIDYVNIHYLYAASFSGHKPESDAGREAFDYYYDHLENVWPICSVYGKGLAALTLHRYGDADIANRIVASLKSMSRTTEDMGMFWRENRRGYFWYEAPIEIQALMIALFDEVAGDSKSVEEMKIWLLRNKQTNNWLTTKATAEACYALLMTGNNLLDENRSLDIRIGGEPLAEASRDEIRPEAGTGYFKTSWAGGDVTPEMGRLEVTNPNNHGVAWGGLYWQYLEKADKVTGAETDLGMEKQIFIKRNTPRGPELVRIEEGTAVKVGDLLTVRVILRAHKDYEYVHLKDMRAAGLEPVKTVSGYRYQDGLWYYESVKDASTNFFIPSLVSGTYVFEYDLRVSHAGDFSNGVTTFQCMYAPEYSAHSEGVRVKAE